MTTIVAVGDSIAFGVGDGGDKDVGPGWSGRLALAIGAERHQRLAWPGARLAELTALQMPAAVIAEPDIALVSIGGNDAIRRGFDADRFSEGLHTAISELHSRVPAVVVATLPDISLTCQIPKGLRPHLHDRVALLNRAISEAATACSVHVLDRWTDDHSYLQSYLAADRVHPSARGYQSLAQNTAGVLGLQVRPTLSDPDDIEPAAAQSGWWLAAHGIPWALKRSLRLVPTVVSLLRQGSGSGLSLTVST